MKQSSEDSPGKNTFTDVKTFSVPFALEEIKENINITTNSSSKFSQEQIINQAIKLHLEGNIKEASKYYQYCLNQGFQDYRIFSNYGSILKGNNKLQEAELMTRKAIELKPYIADAYNNLGNILRDLGKLKEAELMTRKTIELKPDLAEAHNNLGNILRDLGKLKEAELMTRKAIELKPDLAEAHNNLGTILNVLGKLKEAELSTRKAIELKPDFANAYSNVGSILRDLGRLQEAELVTRKAIELNHHCAETHANMGTILRDLGKLKEAELSLLKAIELNHHCANAFFNLSFIELQKGDYQSGLEHYEFRFKKQQPTIPHINPSIKRVRNEKLTTREKLLVISEQGFGDTLQYMRYIPYLRELGLDVSFCPQLKLHSLIKTSRIDPNPLTPDQANKVSEGKWIPLLSLPRYLKVRPENPIISKPYIYSKDELNKKWKHILSTENKPIIGINWQGNPTAEKNYNKGRSLPLETFSTLARNNNFKFLSLQKGFGSEQLDHCSFKNKFVDCQPEINDTWDFLENAAIIKNCDLIITSDTSIAHLAGGIGKSTWILLKDCPEWRWGLEGERSFWYPSMRLFRQKERDNWHEVMKRVSIELKKEIG